MKIQGSVKNFILEDFKVVARDGTITNLPDVRAEIEDGRVVGGDHSSGLMLETEHFIRLSKIVNKRDGREYEVPNQKVPNELQAIHLGQYVCDWLVGRLAEVKVFAEKERRSK